MAPDLPDLQKRMARKLTKRRKEGHKVTVDIPERFRDGDDADEDCTALHGANAYMNQSVFGMIAAAGSQVDFNARFDGQSSDEDDESVEPSSQSSQLRVDKPRSRKTPQKPEHHKRKFSESRLLRSLSGLGSKSKSKSKSSPKRSDPSRLESPSYVETPEVQEPRISSSYAPVMSRMLAARAELSMRPSFDLSRTPNRSELVNDGDDTTSNLAKRLMEIFEFEKAEDVIEGMEYGSSRFSRH